MRIRPHRVKHLTSILTQANKLMDASNNNRNGEIQRHASTCNMHARQLKNSHPGLNKAGMMLCLLTSAVLVAAALTAPVSLSVTVGLGLAAVGFFAASVVIANRSVKSEASHRQEKNLLVASKP